MRRILNLLTSILFSIFTMSAAQAESTFTESLLNSNGSVSLSAVSRKNEIVTIKGKISCNEASECGSRQSFSDSYLLDSERGVKYFPIRDERGGILASSINIHFVNGKNFWFKMTAPPKEVKVITVYIPGVNLFEEVEITDK